MTGTRPEDTDVLTYVQERLARARAEASVAYAHVEALRVVEEMTFEAAAEKNLRWITPDQLAAARGRWSAEKEAAFSAAVEVAFPVSSTQTTTTERTM